MPLIFFMTACKTSAWNKPKINYASLCIANCMYINVYIMCIVYYSILYVSCGFLRMYIVYVYCIYNIFTACVCLIYLYGEDWWALSGRQQDKFRSVSCFRLSPTVQVQSRVCKATLEKLDDFWVFCVLLRPKWVVSTVLWSHSLEDSDQRSKVAAGWFWAKFQ